MCQWHSCRDSFQHKRYAPEKWGVDLWMVMERVKPKVWEEHVSERVNLYEQMKQFLLNLPVPTWFSSSAELPVMKHNYFNITHNWLFNEVLGQAHHLKPIWSISINSWSSSQGQLNLLWHRCGATLENHHSSQMFLTSGPADPLVLILNNSHDDSADHMTLVPPVLFTSLHYVQDVHYHLCGCQHNWYYYIK